MTQQPYGQYPQPGYGQPQYQQPAPAAPGGFPQQPGQYAPAPPQQWQQPPAGPPAVRLDTLGGGVAGQEIKQDAPATLPSFTDLEGRLLYVLPKSVDSSGQFGDKLIADVVFFDGAPISHTIRDKKVVQLTTPIQPGQLMTDLWITSSRIVNGLKPVVGRTSGFAVRLQKEGKAFVLVDATPQEAEHVANQVAAIRAGQGQAAAAANPFLQNQGQTPGQPPAGGPQPQYGQQFQVPPPGYGATAAGPVPIAGQQAVVAGQQFTATGNGPFPGQQFPAPESPQGAPAVPPPPPSEPQAAAQQPAVPQDQAAAFAAWQAMQAAQGQPQG